MSELTLYFDVNEKQLLDPKTQKNLRCLPPFFYQEKMAMRLVFINGFNTNGDPNAATDFPQGISSYSIAVDSDYNAETAPLFFRSGTFETPLNSTNNIWTDTFTLNTQNIASAIQNKNKLNAVCEVKFLNNSGDIIWVVQFGCAIHNTVAPTGTPLPVENIEYPTEAPNDGKAYMRQSKAWVEPKATNLRKVSPLSRQGYDIVFSTTDADVYTLTATSVCALILPSVTTPTGYMWTARIEIKTIESMEYPPPYPFSITVPTGMTLKEIGTPVTWLTPDMVLYLDVWYSGTIAYVQYGEEV